MNDIRDPYASERIGITGPRENQFHADLSSWGGSIARIYKRTKEAGALGANLFPHTVVYTDGMGTGSGDAS